MNIICICINNNYSNILAVTQAYVILLVKSEIIKLNDIGSFRFVNNAAEAECKLHIEYPRQEVHVDETNVMEKDKKDDTEEKEMSNTNPENIKGNIV